MAKRDWNEWWVAKPVIGHNDNNVIRYPEIIFVFSETVAALDAHFARNGPSGLRQLITKENGHGNR